MSEEVVETKKSHNWLLMVEGIALIILSFLLFTTPVQSINFLVKLLGVWWMVSGVASLVWIAFDRAQWGWKLLMGILGILAGLIILDHPLFATFLVPTLIIYIMGIMGIIIGMVALIMAFTGNGWGTGLLGILSIVFGIILLANPVFVLIGLPYVLGGIAAVGGVSALIGFFR